MSVMVPCLFPNVPDLVTGLLESVQVACEYVLEDPEFTEGHFSKCAKKRPCLELIPTQAKAFDGDVVPIYLGFIGDSCGYNFITYGQGHCPKFAANMAGKKHSYTV